MSRHVEAVTPVDAAARDVGLWWGRTEGTGVFPTVAALTIAAAARHVATVNGRPPPELDQLALRRELVGKSREAATDVARQVLARRPGKGAAA